MINERLSVKESVTVTLTRGTAHVPDDRKTFTIDVGEATNEDIQTVLNTIKEKSNDDNNKD